MSRQKFMSTVSNDRALACLPVEGTSVLNDYQPKRWHAMGAETARSLRGGLHQLA